MCVCAVLPITSLYIVEFEEDTANIQPFGGKITSSFSPKLEILEYYGSWTFLKDAWDGEMIMVIFLFIFCPH